MHDSIFLHFLNLFFAGMLAGIETGVHFGLGAPPKALSEQSQIQLRQALVLKLRVLVPVFFVPTLASAIAITAIDGLAPGLCHNVCLLHGNNQKLKRPPTVGAKLLL
jgi:hypothetical protein